jgi:hypothetical protein
MAYPSIGRGYRRNRRDKAEKEESKDDAKKAAPRRATPGERARAMSAAVGLDTSPETPKIGIDGKAEAGPADMMRRKSATDTGMVAEKNPKSIAEAKKKGSDTFIGKDGRKKAAVTKEELEASGLSLRDYLNKQKGKTRKEPAMKKGGDVAKYAFGGSVRGSGCATKGVRAAKMVTMKGS